MVPTIVLTFSVDKCALDFCLQEIGYNNRSNPLCLNWHFGIHHFLSLYWIFLHENITCYLSAVKLCHFSPFTTFLILWMFVNSIFSSVSNIRNLQHALWKLIQKYYQNFVNEWFGARRNYITFLIHLATKLQSGIPACSV